MVEDSVRKVLLEMATIQPATEQPEAQESEPDQPEIDTAILDNLPDGVLAALETAYDEAPERFNKSRVREAWQAATGKRPKTEKEDKIFTAFLAYVAR
jgi:hypothetical protein